VWAERPHHWQTDIYGSRLEAEAMFEACIRRSMKAKLLDPSGEVTMDFAMLSKGEEDGQSKPVVVKGPMRDGGTETWG
jgi:hypothetical protein